MSYKDLISTVKKFYEEDNIVILKEISVKLKTRLQELVDDDSSQNCNVDIPLDSQVNKKWEHRCITESLIIKEKKAARSSRDGNCLFHSCSLYLVKNESLSSLLRMLTSLELYVNAELYVKHDFFEKTFSEGYFQTLKSVFVAAISNDVLMNTTDNNIEHVKETAVRIMQPCVFVPFLAVMALANVINSKIHVFTDRISDGRLFHMYNCVIDTFI